ncbi:MAG: ribosomal L7Ae/L30e/S12e/Gadd45 family protein [Lachnospiraceae bacterium]|nr:ribosomal L7Ae/L30e/S12e/Gadd45 family protein [Lachnospiraceae bacterium]
MLGLATRSRNVVSGGFATEQAVKSGKAYLVIIAEDASDNTRKKYSNMCEFYEVPCAYYSTKEVLGHAMGKEERTTLAVTDEGFADSIRKHLLDSK